MNLNQLYNSSTTEERLEAITLMLRTIETRQSKLILVYGRLIRDRRGAFRGAHFINQRRRRFIPRPIYLSGFMLMLTLTSIATWVSFFNIPPAYAAPLMLLHLLSLSVILFVKPYNRSAHAYAI